MFFIKEKVSEQTKLNFGISLKIKKNKKHTFKLNSLLKPSRLTKRTESFQIKIKNQTRKEKRRSKLCIIDFFFKNHHFFINPKIPWINKWIDLATEAFAFSSFLFSPACFLRTLTQPIFYSYFVHKAFELRPRATQFK